MDFFEKAHVVKRESSRKEHKSEEAVKKQLKQMLTGYKRHDSKLIKSCEDTFDPNKLLDESSSVSGFSDLNLTSSSNELDTTQGTVGSDSDDYINSDEKEPSHTDLPSSDNNTSESLDLSKESISEYEDDIQTLSDNMSSQVTLDTSPDISDVTISSDSSDGCVTDSHKSEFDADGVLACKILERLKNKGVVKKKATKRKLKPETDEVDSHIAVKYNEPSTSTLDINKNRPQSSHVAEKETIDDSVSDSSDFVSIAPTDMTVQSLNEILGEYRHPTVRNLPDVQNLHSTNNSGSFSIENIEGEDLSIQYDDDIENVDPKESSNDIITDIDTVDSSNIHVSESTDIYDETIQSDNTSEKEMSVEYVDTNFQNPIKVFYGDSNCVFLIKNLAELYIHGKVIVTALAGAVEVLGHTLTAEPCELYAPNYNYTFCLKPGARDNSIEGSLFSKLRKEGLSVSDVEDIVTQREQFDAVISLKKLNKYRMDFVENNMKSTDLFSKISKNVENCFKKSSEMLGCSLYLTRPYKTFEELPCAGQVLKFALEDRSRGIITGGKGLGKSTFLRYCVNRLLSRGPVLVLDLDPGQAEFTVAGNISATVVDQPLLGPNFTHLKTPNLMLNIGMINTMDNPRRYSAAVSALITHCNNDEQLKTLPWVVNTMGMCNALGLKFMTQIILEIQPTYLLQINTRNPKKRFEILLSPENVKKLYEESFYYDSLFRNVRWPEDLDYAFFLENHTDSSPKNNSSLAPRDERYLNFLAYFSTLLNSRQMKGLLEITPYEVNLGDLRIGFNIKIGNDAVAKVINGKIIALCQLTTLDNAGKVFTLKDKPLLCHGHGLIRGIDLDKEILYVVTPTPGEKLSQVDTLVYADWVPELRGQEKHLPNDVTVPYRTSSVYQQRQLMFTPKRRFNPLQLLKMSRNT